MSNSILDCLYNAQVNLDNNGASPVSRAFGAEQLQTAIYLLENGYPLPTPVEPLIQEHGGQLQNVPPAEPSDPLTETGVKQRAALEMVLMFHGPIWDEAKRTRWNRLASLCLGADYQQCTSHGLPAANSFDATTRVMCDCVRAALGQPAK